MINSFIKEYPNLAKGELAKLGGEIPEYSLFSLVNKLGSSSWIGDEFIEFISNYFGIDIYVLDSRIEDVYLYGGDNFIKNRNSIILLCSGSHYELVGIQIHNNIGVYWKPTSEIIQFLQKRIQIKRKG